MHREFHRESLPAAATFYASELGKLTRPARGWARGNCPFHKSKSGVSFSVNLSSGGFYCFGCGVKGGDVLAFVMKRHNMDFKTAAKELGAWGPPLSYPERRRLAEQKRKREQELAELEAKRKAEKRKRLDVRDCLHTLESHYKQLERRLRGIRKGQPESSPGEADQITELLSLLLPQIRDAEAEYYALAGLNNGK